MLKEKIKQQAETIITQLIKDEFLKQLDLILKHHPYPGGLDPKPIYKLALQRTADSIRLTKEQQTIFSDMSE